MNGRWVGLAVITGLALGLPAAAQAPQSPDPACVESPGQPQKVSAAFGRPMSEAATLIKAGDFAAASAKVDLASDYAVCPSAKMAVEKYRIAIATNLANTASQPDDAPEQ